MRPSITSRSTYCNFASGVLPRELAQRYLEALEREICRAVKQDNGRPHSGISVSRTSFANPRGTRYSRRSPRESKTGDGEQQPETFETGDQGRCHAGRVRAGHILQLAEKTHVCDTEGIAPGSHQVRTTAADLVSSSLPRIQ